VIAELLLFLTLAVSCSWLLAQSFYGHVKVTPLKELSGKPFYSIIVAVKDEDMETLRGLRECLLNLRYPNYEVLVVSDDPKERWGEVRECLRGINLLFRDDPRGGKAGALNYGCSFASGSHLVFLDAEARVSENFLEELSKFAGYDALALKLRVRNDNGSYGLTTDFSMRALFAGRDALGLHLFPNGSALVIKALTLKEVGGWREGAISEDLELGLRLALRGVRVRFVPVEVSTLAPLTSGDLQRQLQRWGYGSGQLAKESISLFKEGVRGIEGWVYVNQWAIYSLYLVGLTVYALLSPLLKLSSIPLLISLIVYGVVVAVYGRSVGGGDATMAVLTAFSSFIGYVRGVMKLPFKWRVTPKSSSSTYPLWGFVLGTVLSFISVFYALMGEPIQSLVLLGLGASLTWSSRPTWI
jgi:Glycosyltransferases, probably involved in cell wall biogenesis